MRRSVTILGLFVACSFAAAAAAQQGGSAIRGRVTDEQQGVLPGAAVVVTHAESGTIRETTTGPDGSYLVPGLIPGPYRIQVELAGFSRLVREDIVLRVGTTLQLDLSLRVGAVQESLTVTAVAPQVDLTSAQVGGNVSAAEIAELPSVNRNFTAFVGLLPGVVYNPSATGSDSVTINGTTVAIGSLVGSSFAGASIARFWRCR